MLPGSPAEKAGIEATDIFESIEGQSTRDMSLPEIRSALAGAPGSSVNVSVVRARRAEPQKMTITREVVSIPPVSDKMLEDGIGYVKVDALTKGKAQEIAGKIKSLEKSGAKKLVLDLRNTAEGEESEGVATANLFLNHGTITYLQGQKFPREAFNADPAKAVTSLPVAVLVNKGTAGAAEIVAAAILENARGDVVGDKLIYDAPTAHGGSGGPVFDSRGQVIGINSAYLDGFSGGTLGISVQALRPLIQAAQKRTGQSPSPK